MSDGASAPELEVIRKRELQEADVERLSIDCFAAVIFEPQLAERPYQRGSTYLEAYPSATRSPKLIQ